MIVVEVIGARRREQHRLGLRAERLGGAGQEDMPDDFRAGRAAGLAREHDVDAERLQPLRQQRRLGGLAGALAAFERDELARACLAARLTLYLR